MKSDRYYLNLILNLSTMFDPCNYKIDILRGNNVAYVGLYTLDNKLIYTIDILDIIEKIKSDDIDTLSKAIVVLLYNYIEE